MEGGMSRGDMRTGVVEGELSEDNDGEGSEEVPIIDFREGL
jgi:hypothetical protein